MQILLLRRHRTIILVQIRSQIFCQMKQKPELILYVFARIFVKYDEKYASICAKKALAANCAVVPYYL